MRKLISSTQTQKKYSVLGANNIINSQGNADRYLHFYSFKSQYY